MNQIKTGIVENMNPSAITAFPTSETNLYKILHNPQHRQKFHAQLKRFNPLVVGFYRIGLLPLFGASRTVMVLTTRGCKSGKIRSTPIGYFRIGGVVHLFSAWGKRTGWYANLLAHPNEVWIQIGLKKRRVSAKILEVPSEIRQTLAQFLDESPTDAKLLFGWEPSHDKMETSDFSEVYARVLMVRFVEKTG
jgi:deazaflavin-dependent oxidoreductase (nitroreductase family)